MAVEPLYELLGSTFRGIWIANQLETMEIKACGSFRGHAETLTRFEAASGMLTNTAKSVAVPLCDVHAPSKPLVDYP
uniref:Uncharacterized protein n=1 Tax=Hyaloperonospora arabidopsidis (strain Emoy2) TaxID=559515 RepID=M4BC02_HYAAE